VGGEPYKYTGFLPSSYDVFIDSLTFLFLFSNLLISYFLSQLTNLILDFISRILHTSIIMDAFPRPVHTFRRSPYPAISPTQPHLSQAGKTILITGGATGIGLDISTSFAAAGASHIIIIGRRSDKLAAAKASLESTYASTKIHPFAASITDPGAVSSIFEETRRSIGEIDVLVLCAAFSAPRTSIVTLSASDLEESFKVNVLGNLALVRNFLSVPPTAETPKTIIDISSSATHLPVALHAAYSASKAALTMLVRAVGAENAEGDGGPLRVHSLHPGAVFTEMQETAGWSYNSAFHDDGAYFVARFPSPLIPVPIFQ
jgi:NAD(P)-dependent dehydrogenase (short-subunit alcohol dehydrogenase family)